MTETESPAPPYPPAPSQPGRAGPGMPTTEVRGSTFTKAAGEFVTEHEDLAKDIRRILDGIAGLGDFAGTDETANTFRQGYSSALHHAETYVKALRDVYPVVADRLADMRTAFDLANWATIQSLPKVADPPRSTGPDGKITS